MQQENVQTVAWKFPFRDQIFVLAPHFNQYSELSDPRDAAVDWQKFGVYYPQNIVNNDVKVKFNLFGLSEI